MKRTTLAILLLALLAPLAFARDAGFPGIPGHAPPPSASAQTPAGAAPAFPDDALTYYLDAGANGSSTAITIGTIPFTPGTFAGGTDFCGEAYEYLAPDIGAFVSSAGTASTVLSVSSACVITYTGAATDSAIDSTRQGWSLRVNIVDSRTPTGGAPTSGNGGIDDFVLITVQLTNKATDTAALDALYNAAGGASWNEPWKESLIHTFDLTTGSGFGFQGYSDASGNRIGSFSGGTRSFTYDGSTWSAYYILAGSDCQLRFWTTAHNSKQNIFNGFRLTRGTGASTLHSGRLSPYTTSNLPGGGKWRTSAHCSLVRVSGRHNIYLWGKPDDGSEGTQFMPIDFRPRVALSTQGRVITLWMPNLGLTGDATAALTPLASLNKLVTFDLNGNSLTGALPASLAKLTTLTTFNLGGNAGLTADTATLKALAVGLTSLTTLDLSGTGICVSASDPEQADVRAWIATIRARSGGVARVETCDGAAPRFAAGPVVHHTFELTAGTDAAIRGYRGGTLAAIGALRDGGTVTQGGADQDFDAIIHHTTNKTLEVVAVPARAPAAKWNGWSVRIGDQEFAFADATHALAHGGDHWTWSGVNTDPFPADGEDFDAEVVRPPRVGAGTTSDPDSTLVHTFELTGGADDQIQGYDPTARETVHTYELTAATQGGSKGYGTNPGGNYGSIRNNSGTITRNGRTYALERLYQQGAGLAFSVNERSQVIADFAGLHLRIGSTSLPFSGTPNTVSGRTTFLWGSGWPTSSIPASGNFNALLTREPFGAIRNTSGAVTLAGQSRTIQVLSQTRAGATRPVNFYDNQPTRPASDYDGLVLKIGGNILPFAEASSTTLSWARRFAWDDAPAGMVPASGNFSAELHRPVHAGYVRVPSHVAHVGAPGLACAIVSANQNASDDPDDWSAAGTDVSGQFFAVPDGASCALGYAGDGTHVTRADGTLEAISIRLAVNDGLDHAAGTFGDDADSIVDVTLVLRTLTSDTNAIWATYDASGGSSWTTRTGWEGALSFSVVHTYQITAATSGSLTGYRDIAVTSPHFGSRGSGGTYRWNSGLPPNTAVDYAVREAYQHTNGTLTFGHDQQGRNDFDTLALRIGSTILQFSDGGGVGWDGVVRRYTWSNAPTGLITAGTVNIQIGTTTAAARATPSSSNAYHGLTLTGGRVSGLELPDNNLDTPNVESTVHAFELTGGTSGSSKGYNGTTGPYGALRGGGVITRNGREYTIQWLSQTSADDSVSLALSPDRVSTHATSDFAGLHLRIGDQVFPFGTATLLSGHTQFEFTDFPADTVPGSGDFEALVVDVDGTPGTPATALARVGELDALTALDLSDNTELAGPIPATLGDLTSLTSLDLSGVGFTGPIPGFLGNAVKLTSLDLSDNALSGDIPRDLADLQFLTTLDLSGNAALTATTEVLQALARHLTRLTSVDLSGTDGICVNAGGMAHADLRAWVARVRATGMGTGVFKVDTCGTATAPAFAVAAASVDVASGASGASTPIALGDFAVVYDAAAGFAGAAEPACVVSATLNASNDPADFGDAAGTDLSADFTATRTSTTTAGVTTYSCEVEYMGDGTALAAADTTLEAVSVSVGVHDGVDPEEGTLGTDADGTVQVTMRLIGPPTDRDALDALYDGAGGGGWTAQTNWRYATEHTFQLTAATDGDLTGYRHTSVGTGPIGSLRGGGAYTLSGVTHTIQMLVYDAANDRVQFEENQPAQPVSRWNALSLRIGSTVLAFADATTAGTSSGWRWTWSNIATSPIAVGNFDAVVLSRTVVALAGTWTGVTLDGTSNRVTGLALSDNNLAGAIPAAFGTLAGLGTAPAMTTLDLSDNSLTGSIPTTLGDVTSLTSLDLSGNTLSGAIPSELGELTALTTLDLSDNAGLTITDAVLNGFAQATSLAALESLDLSGITAVCADPNDPDQADVEGWIETIRGTNTNTGVAKITTCGTPADPAFTESAESFPLNAGADGSTTAIEIGAPAFTESTYVGADDATCSIVSARTNGSNDPAMWTETGGNAITGFTVSGCTISYEGTGITSTEGSLEAVSIKLAISDGIDPAEGTIDSAFSGDDTIQVTVKLRGLISDRDALDAFYDAAGGSSWTTDTNWDEVLIHTYSLTVGTYQAFHGFAGGGGANAFGDVGSTGTITRNGRLWTLLRLRQHSDNHVQFWMSQAPNGNWADFEGLSLRRGDVRVAIDVDDRSGTSSRMGWRFTAPSNFLNGLSGAHDVYLVNAKPPASGRHGVTITGTPQRVTGLALPDNNLAGALPAAFTDLDGLTSLDLSGNTGLAGAGAVPVDALDELRALTSLDLSGIGYSTMAAGLGPRLTALTTLDLSGNTLAALPTDFNGLTALTDLDLNGNRLTALPSDFGDLTALTDLDLSGNAIASLPATFGDLTALTTLDLSDNSLNDMAAVATELSTLTALTTLDLSGNSGLTGAIPMALRSVTGLTSLDLSGTGVCVNPATEADTETWLAAIRARTPGVAKVTTCGTPNAAYFIAAGAEPTFKWTRANIEQGASGAGTGNAIAIGRSTVVQGTYSGGTTATCTLGTVKESNSLEIADFADGATATDVAGFTIDASTCQVSYTGSGLTGRGDFVAVHVKVAISDGVDPSTGRTSTDADDELRIIVRLVGLGTDRLALVDFYQNTNGASWTTSANWDLTPGSTLDGTWHGVTVTSNRVSALALPSNGLRGTIPDSFRDLSNITTLDLSGNPGLTGVIPFDEFITWTGLTSLDLSDSGWSGQITGRPGTVALVVGTLTSLDLSGNALSGSIPDTALGSAGTTMRTLDLSDNAALGGSLTGLAALTGLTTLDLTGTRLCVNPATETAVETWLDGRRTAGASVAVHTCGAPNAPTLADNAITVALDRQDGSSTPIAVATPTFRAGTYSGGDDVCTFTSVIANPSFDPDDFLTTGTDLSGQFAIDGSTCAITYTGTGLERVDGTREAVSIAISVTDGVNATGGVDASVDDTMRITVKLLDANSDRAALRALYDATNGDSWTSSTSWTSSSVSNSWYGVTVVAGRVTRLSLPNNNLSGRLPALLGDLTQLESINLSENGGLGGGIPFEFAALGSVTNFDVRATRVCARNIGIPAVNAWLANIRAQGGAVRLGSCPVAAPAVSSAGITVVEEGDAAPTGARYGLQLTCGGSTVSISLAAGERYAASASPNAVCSLTVTDRVDATAVRGEFSGQTLGGDVTVTFVLGIPEADEAAPAPGEPDPVLERTLVEGVAFARWAAPQMPIAEAVRPLTLCVVAVYWWDAPNQAWRSWFPGGDALGVNTLEVLERGGIYVFSTEERTRENCGLLAEDAQAAVE